MLQFYDKSKGYSSREERDDNGNGNFAMAQDIVQNCFTKRTNLFKSAYEIAIGAMEKFKVNRINAREDINSPKMTFKYAMEIIQQLVENGYIIQVLDSDRQLIRSMNKTEQRKNKINYEEALI